MSWLDDLIKQTQTGWNPYGVNPASTAATTPTVAPAPAPAARTGGGGSFGEPTTIPVREPEPTEDTVLGTLLEDASETQTSTPPRSGGGGGGGSGIRKSSDAPQVAALRRMIESEFAQARDIKLGNVRRDLALQDSTLLDMFDTRLSQLLGLREDNLAAAADTSFLNLANRVRERMDIISQAAAMGAGESDSLRAQMQALRNWDAAQGDINRAFYDTQRSLGSTATELEVETRTARINAERQAIDDEAQLWQTFYSQKADALTQLGNISANPYSNQFGVAPTAFAEAAAAAGQAYEAPEVPSELTEWSGVEPETTKLNTYQPASAGNLSTGEPEGATLRRWT